MPSFSFLWRSIFPFFSHLSTSTTVIVPVVHLMTNTVCLYLRLLFTFALYLKKKFLNSSKRLQVNSASSGRKAKGFVSHCSSSRRGEDVISSPLFLLVSCVTNAAALLAALFTCSSPAGVSAAELRVPALNAER